MINCAAMENMIYSFISDKKKNRNAEHQLAGVKGILGVDLSFLSFGGIAAIVSDFNRSDTIADKTIAIEYADVVEALAQYFTLLPARFGSVMESSDAIIQMLERNRREIKKNLLKVENKYEFGLKVLCDTEKLIQEMKEKSATVGINSANADPEVKPSVYREWVNRKLKEHRLEELLLAYVESVIAEITGYLTRWNTESKFKKMSTPTIIIEGVFLLGRERKDDLIEAVADLQKKHVSLTFVLTGPWPPYNFVDFKIK